MVFCFICRILLLHRVQFYIPGIEGAETTASSRCSPNIFQRYCFLQLIHKDQKRMPYPVNMLPSLRLGTEKPPFSGFRLCSLQKFREPDKETYDLFASHSDHVRFISYYLSKFLQFLVQNYSFDQLTNATSNN